MRKKEYLKPTMRVVKIQQRTMLMQASANPSSTLDVTYHEELWEEEKEEEQQ